MQLFNGIDVINTLRRSAAKYNAHLNSAFHPEGIPNLRDRRY